MDVIVAKALISEAVEDMAAERITANNKPMRPFGRWFKMKVMKM
jgi:hypothetical protein